MTVFVPFTSLIPWDNCPSYFTKYLSQYLLSGPLIRCLYFSATPEIWWVTALYSWVFWNCAVNKKIGMGVFLPLDLKLELGPSVSTLGGYAVCTIAGGIGTSGGIMLRPEGAMWTLCWKLVESFPSLYSMTLDCTEERGLVLSGCTFWGAMADFSLFVVVEGLLFSSHYLPSWKISGRVAQLLSFGSLWCWKMSSSRCMNYPIPWRTHHPKGHFPTSETPKW